MLKNVEIYEIMWFEDVGVKVMLLVMGKYFGCYVFKDKLKEFGFELGDNVLQDVFCWFKDLVDCKKYVYDEDIEVLVEDEINILGESIKVIVLMVIVGIGGFQKVILIMDVDGQYIIKEVMGDGLVDVIFNVIKVIVLYEVILLFYQVYVVIEGMDVQVEVFVWLEVDGCIVIGKGVDIDMLVVFVWVYVLVMNKLV